MALVDIGDTWHQDMDTAERLHKTILCQISERGRQHRASTAYSQATEEIRRNLAQLAPQVVSLKQSLEVQSRGLTTGERNRRESLLDSLSRKEKQLKEIFSRSSFAEQSQERGQLFRVVAAAAGPPPGGLADMGITGWGAEPTRPTGGLRGAGSAVGDVRDGEETEATAGSSSQTLKQRQQEALDQQDQGLDLLHGVILRQKSMAQQIGVEVSQQNIIIDDIDTRMDLTTQRLLDNTHNVRVVDHKDRTCGYWVVITLLFIAIVVVAAI